MNEVIINSSAGDGWNLLQFVTQEALQWGKADLLALGPDLAFDRIGELATYFGAFAAGGSRNVEAVWVILPPVPAISQDTSVEAFRKSFVAAMTEISKGQVSQAIIEERFASLFPIIVANFDGDALIELLKTAPARTAIIVADARQFRLAATSLPEGDRLDEDEWSAHVHQLLREVDVLCHDGDRYAVLDLGSHPPSRSQNFELLKSVGDTGFYSSNGPSPDVDEIVARISRWLIAAKARDIGSVLKEVDADASLSDRQRFFIKLEIYSTGRLNDQVRVLLSDNAAMLENLPVDQALNIARVCEIADDDDRAEALVAAALPSIRAERDFAYALEVAENAGRRDLARAVASAFQKFHPNAPMMGRIAILEAVRAGDYARAAALLAASSDPAETQRTRYYELLAQQTGRLEWNPEKALNAIVTTLPDLSAEAAIEISRALEREHRRLDSLSFMLALGDDLGSTGLLNLIRLSSLAIQAGDLSSADEKIERLIDLCVAHLSAHPNDGMVRTRLASLLAPNITASDGLAHLVFAVMKRAQALPRIRQKPKVSDRPLPVDPDDLKPRLERIWRWLREKGDGVLLLGLHPLPAEELDLPPDRVLAAILRAVDHIGDELVDDVDYHVMTLFVAAASAVAPLSVEPDEDLTVLRTAAAKLVIAGKGQTARDLAEHALTIAGDRPERRRQALFTFSDVYARLGMKAEALVALSAAFEASSDATWDQIWFESNLLFRLLRDANMSELGFDLLKRSRQALEELGLADRDGYRIETMELQARLALFGRQGGEDAEVGSLLELAQKNAEAVHAQRDDLMPIAMMLNTLVGIAKSRQLTIVAPAEELVGRLISSLSGPRQQMVRAVGPAPSLADIAAVAANIDEARYADDTGYDLRHLRIMARGLVGEAVASVDPKVLTYAIEASADRSMSIKDGGGTKVPVERLLAREDAPEAAAAQLSRLGVAVVCMALFDDKLATIEFEKGQLSDVTLEEPPIFSTAALHKWSERFPWDYKLEEKWLSGDDVRESVAHIGLTKLPDRSVMVADAQLQRFPPSLFTIEGNYAGYSHAIGVAPSLEWLTASRKLDRQGDGSARMWIPISSDVPHNAVLKLLADQVEPLLAREGIALERDDQPSPDFAKADVAIIGGHGGLAEANRFFRSVADEEHGITGISEMGDLTRHSRLAILFVCSGGRIDPHPETGMAIGLARQLVARGCSAVIAPAWPIPFFMARPWLEGFLAEWRKGSLLLDAYHAANQAVGTSTSWDPKRTFAMSLYGDPFIKAS